MRLHQESCVMVFFLCPGRSGKHQILFFSSAGPWTGEACPLSPNEEHSKLLLTHGLATWTCAVLTEAVCCFKEAHWALLPSSSLARFLPYKWVTKRGAGDRNEEDRSWPQLRSFFLEYCRSLRILSAEAEGWRQRLWIGFKPHGNPSLSPTSQDHSHAGWKSALRQKLPNLPLINTAVLKLEVR